MRTIDLTHCITEQMPVYPGTKPPSLSPVCTHEQHGFRETLLTMYSHTGTHMDAPAHVCQGRPTLDALDAGRFAGSALVIDCRDCAPGETIGMERIERVRKLADRADFLLFCTGWDKKWGGEDYFTYPVLAPEVVDYLLRSGKKGVGLDTIGLDPVADGGLSLHHRLLDRGDTVIIENLCRLDELGAGLCWFAALPLKFENADGAPVRAVAFCQE